MKIAHFIPGLNAASGVSAFCVEAANEMALADHEVSVVYTDNDSYRPSDRVTLVHADSLSELPFVPEVVHIHALWMACLVNAMRWCRKQGVPYVVSPHGSLMPRVFTHGRLKKWVVWHFLLKPLVKSAAAIHCTGEAEKAAVQALLGERCPPVIIAPLGVYMPQVSSKPKAETKSVLFLGRLGEEKGLIKLLDSWRQVAREGWQLVIAGPDWENHRAVLERKIATEAIAGVEFTGAADARLKDELYRTADIFVLPSPMENFSHTVLEALSYAVPVIATKGTPWAELESEHCGRWIDQGVEPLSAALSQLMAMSDEERAALGANGRRLAAERYQWSKVADRLMATYETCVGTIQ